MALTTTGTLPGPIQAYYEARFLLRSKFTFVYKQFGLAGRIPKGQGNKVVWNRMTIPTAKTTALTEGTDPTPTGLSATLVSANLQEYGNYEQITSKLQMTAIDSTIKESIDVLAYEAALSMDTIVRNQLSGAGSVQYASTVVARNSLHATDIVQVSDIRKALRQLWRMGATPFKDGKYVAVMHPDVIFDLQGDTAWVNAHIYTESGIDNIYNGEAGTIYGVRVTMTQNNIVLAGSGSASTNVNLSYIMGQGFFGVSDMLNLTTYLDNPSPRSALRMYADLGWKAAFASAPLNDSFAVRLESGATA